MKRFSTVVAQIIAVGIVLAAIAWSQDHSAAPATKTEAPAKPVTYEATEVETLRLQLKQKDAQFAQQAYNFAQGNLQKASADFYDEAERIVKAHGWPSDTTVDPNSLKFSAPPKPAAPEAPKPDKKP